VRRYFYTTEGRHIARLNETGSEYNKAEILRDGTWEKAFPTDLLWNMEPVSKDKAIDILVKWNPTPVTKAEALRLLDREPVRTRKKGRKT